MTEEEINVRIIELEALIAPLATELTILKRRRAGIKAGKHSVVTRRKLNEARNSRIWREAEERQDDKYRRNGGLIQSIAKKEDLSRQTIRNILLRKIND